MGLDTAWQRALTLAWQSFLAGTTPVGAVVIGPADEVVAEGRGRRYEHPEADRRQLAYCHIAHAEINALAGLPPTRHYEDHILLTTLEPCCMCLGAAIQSTITRVHFAGRDPYGGASDLVIDTPQARRRPVAVTGPLADPRGRFAELLHVRWLLDFGASQPVLEPQQRTIPDIHQVAVRPATSSLFDRLKRECADVGQAMIAAEGLFGDSQGQPLVRVGLRVLIADADGMEVIGEASTGAQAVQLARDTRPDVVVMDIRMPAA